MDKKAKILIGVLFLILIAAAISVFAVKAYKVPDPLMPPRPVCVAFKDRQCDDSSLFFCRHRFCNADGQWDEWMVYEFEDYPDWSCDPIYKICAKYGQLKPKKPVNVLFTPTPIPAEQPIV